jgi:2-methylisocitrate lyase-like PEP mutase family enzyme
MTTPQQAQADAFRALHAVNAPTLLLPNAWDAASAQLIAQCGAKAIATTSAGVSWSHGFPDGEHLPCAIHLAAIREIIRVAAIPVTVDVEGGYSEDPDVVAHFISDIINAGAIGINIEDGASPPDLFAAKITAIRALTKKTGVDFFINARTDVYLRGLASPDSAVRETIERAKLYRNAGADGIFVPGLVNLVEIKEIAASVQLPLNIMALPGIAPVHTLAEHGVRRVSVGMALHQASLAAAKRATKEMLDIGHFSALFAESIGYNEMNEMFSSR